AVPRGRRGRGDRGARRGGAAPARECTARGARARGYARRGRLLSAARGLAQQDGRISPEEVALQARPVIPRLEAWARYDTALKVSATPGPLVRWRLLLAPS